MYSTQTETSSSPKFTDVKKNSCGIESSAGLRNSIRIKKELKDLANLSTQGLKHVAFGYYSNNILVN